MPQFPATPMIRSASRCLLFLSTSIFLVFLQIGSFGTALCVAQDGRTEIIVVPGQAAPDGNGQFGNFYGYSLNDKSEVIFSGFLTNTNGGSTDDGGLYLELRKLVDANCSERRSSAGREQIFWRCWGTGQFRQSTYSFIFIRN